MKIAHITTTNATRRISSKGDIDFCLAPFALEDKTYREYFINARRKGRYVILDNGVAENNLILNDDLIELALMMNVNEIIVPDVIGDIRKTRVLRKNFMKKYYNILNAHNIKIMSVIQGSTFKEYYNEFLHIKNDNRIDTIGVPFRMRFTRFKNAKHITENHAMNRLTFLKYMKFGVSKPVHCLGCNSLWELKEINKLDFVRSIDTKLISRYIINDKKLNFKNRFKPIKKLYLNDNLKDWPIRKIIKSIKEIKEVLENEENR